MRPIIATVAVLTLALAACRQGPDDNLAIDESNSLNGAEIETLPPDEGNEETAAANASNSSMPVPPDPVGVATIPAQYHGRWGMVPADCTSSRGDAKGLITVGSTTIRFYEAVATLKERRPAIPEAFSGLFSFTGEGQNWEKVMTFTRTGETLKRADEGGPSHSYTRCK
ncbi:MAG TPA: hypothetical protein VNJ05_00585 [Sphingomicrobium sp.]|nr:hypothetical protein [Sphingomicrobium sp.]